MGLQPFIRSAFAQATQSHPPKIHDYPRLPHYLVDVSWRYRPRTRSQDLLPRYGHSGSRGVLFQIRKSRGICHSRGTIFSLEASSYRIRPAPCEHRDWSDDHSSRPATREVRRNSPLRVYRFDVAGDQCCNALVPFHRRCPQYLGRHLEPEIIHLDANHWNSHGRRNMVGSHRLSVLA